MKFRKTARKSRMRTLLLRYLLRGVKTLGFARVITKWAEEKTKPDAKREFGYQKRDKARLESWLENAQRSYHLEAEKRVLALFLKWFGKLPRDQRVQAFDKALGGDYGAKSIQRYVDRLFSKTALKKVEVRKKLFGKKLEELKKIDDAFIQLAFQIAPAMDAYEKARKAKAGELFRLRRPYLQSLIAFRGKKFYPDANASPRVSFAHVSGYSPRDGVWHLPFTTVSGLVAKHTGKKPFDAPDEVLKKAPAAPKSPYADKRLNDVPACFLSNADTTGGNSGSPVMNGKGELVGLNFDRVYANISGDFGYSPARSRNIMVDVRFILWYLDEVLGAQSLIQELLPEKKD